MVSHLVPVDRTARPSDQPKRDRLGRPATPCDKVPPTCNRQVVGSNPIAGSDKYRVDGERLDAQRGEP
jgi:hypothetical protein